MPYLIQRFGFTEEEARHLIGLYYTGGIRDDDHQLDDYRMVFLASLKEQLEGLTFVEGIVDDGRVQGDVYQNYEQLEQMRQQVRVLTDKVADLTEDQAREVHSYVLGFAKGHEGS